MLSATSAVFGTSVEVGDSLNKVYAVLGTPTIEYLRNGLFIHLYKNCTVESRAGEVISIFYRNSAPAEPVKTKKDINTVSVEEIMAKAVNGDADAQFRLAYWNQSGKHVPRNRHQAVHWYTQAALQGHVGAQHNLGVIYMKGQGVEKDFEQAYTWALLAASNGNDKLQRALENSLSEEEKLTSTIRAYRIRIDLHSGSPSEAGDWMPVKGIATAAFPPN